ncbi:MAG: amidohydrolase family protein [Acidobacteria bacterium]|nr:amidohydrolase family protein [Acidobacteriota bacterium]
MVKRSWILAFLVLVAPAITPAQGPLTVIRGVTLIDGTGRAPLAGVTVVIEGNRIKEVGTTVQAPAGATTIDGAGKFLIPGLIDAHIHLRGARGRDQSSADQEREGIRALHGYLYAGVTTVFDAGNRPDYIMGLRSKEQSGAIVSPRILATGGTVASPNGHGGPYNVEAWPADRKLLDDHLATKPDLAKIGQDEHGWGTRPQINQLPDAMLEEIIRYYHSKGVRVIVHTSNEHNTLEAIYAGADTMAHPIIQAPVSEQYLKMMAVKRVPTVSTLTIGENYSRLADHPDFLDEPLYQATLEAEERQRLRTEESAKQKENRWAAWMKVMTPVAQENMKRLNETGKDIVAAGTDQSSGPALHRELELLVSAGISPADTIVIATRNAARALGKLEELGTIEPGKLADVVLLNADPTKDIDNAKLVDTVIKNGRIIDRSKLDLPVNRRPGTQ